MAVGSAEGQRGVVADDLADHHRNRFALRRVDLARHDRTARLIGRQQQFAETGARPRAEQPDVVGHLVHCHRQHLQRAVRAQAAPRARPALQTDRPHRPDRNRFAPTVRGTPRCRNRHGYSSPVPTAVPPTASDCSAGRPASIAARAEQQLAAPGADFLADGQRHRVLQMGSAQLDEVFDSARPVRPACRTGLRGPATGAGAARSARPGESHWERCRSTTGRD